MRAARTILEAEVDTLVIHMEDRSTDFLTPIYQGLGYPVIRGVVSQADARKAIQAASRVFMLGHGGPSGLFTRGFFAGDEIGQLLAEKQDGLYVWCNADAYAVRNKLTGLVTGMFISEVGEAAMFGIQATQEEIDFSNNNFSRVVREVLDTGAPHAAIKERYTHAANLVIKFNNDRLYVFDHGTPSPALHASSAALWRSRSSSDDYDAPRTSKNWSWSQLSLFQHDYGQDQDHDQGQEDQDQDQIRDEIEAQVQYWTCAVLDKVVPPQDAAEGIVRHMPDGELYFRAVLQALQCVLELDTNYEEGIKIVLDAILNEL